jgi:FkbM family methyltransferase
MLYTEIFINNDYYFKSAKKDPVIIDCGGNTGLTMLYYKSRYPKAKITVFEPNPVCVNAISNNIRDNKLTQTVVIPKAVWNKESTMKLAVIEGNSAVGSLFTHQKDPGFKEQEISVKTTRLSQYIRSRVDVLKIDIEGAEVDVLREVKSKLHLVDRLIIESHTLTIDGKRVDNTPAVIDMLVAEGYACWFKGGFSPLNGKDYPSMIYAKRFSKGKRQPF